MISSEETSLSPKCFHQNAAEGKQIFDSLKFYENIYSIKLEWNNKSPTVKKAAQSATESESKCPHFRTKKMSTYWPAGDERFPLYFLVLIKGVRKENIYF